VVRDGLGDDVHRVRVVEDPHARAGGRDVVEDLAHHGDRAQRHEEAARPLRLLPDHAVAERDLLVEHAGLEPAGAEARQDRVAAVEARAAVGRGGHGEIDAVRPRHALGEPADEVEAVAVEVDQHNLGAGEALAVLHEAGHCAGGARGTAADVRDLDPGHWAVSPCCRRGRAILTARRLPRQDQHRPKWDMKRPRCTSGIGHTMADRRGPRGRLRP
jgi:hypothetical protein